MKCIFQISATERCNFEAMLESNYCETHQYFQPNRILKFEIQSSDDFDVPCADADIGSSLDEIDPGERDG
jgi:hypothetical protein